MKTEQIQKTVEMWRHVARGYRSNAAKVAQYSKEGGERSLIRAECYEQCASELESSLNAKPSNTEAEARRERIRL